MGIKESSWRKLYDGRWGVVLYDNSHHAKGDTTQVTARDGVRRTVMLDRLITSGPDWQLWAVQSLQTQINTKLAQLAKPVPKAVPPTVRRNSKPPERIWLDRPLTQPEPPPHTDADAPPPRDALLWPDAEPIERAESRLPRMRYDEDGFIDPVGGDGGDTDEADAFYDAYLKDAGDR